MSRWDRFFRNIQQDLKLYVFIIGIFCLYRAGFIAIMKSHLSDAATLKDIITALYYGLRISLKSAGAITAVSFIGCTCLGLLVKSRKFEHLRLWLGYLCSAVLTVLFFARIPYYEQFRMAFNQFLFNTFKDDVNALFFTLVQQYNLVQRLLAAALIGIVLSVALKKWLNTGTIALPRYNARWARWGVRAVLIGTVYLFIMFTRFGGSLTYAYDINWENSGVTKDDLLNEAILDDVQALYRAYAMHERLEASTGVDIDAGRMREYGSYLAGRELSAEVVDDYLKKQAQGAKISKPKHIFLIIAESYANWPLLDEYKDLNIANGLKDIIARQDTVYVPAFLPNGMGTIAGVNGIVTGFTEVNLYLNYQPETYKEPYATALALQMKRLGYRTFFWYAGPDSWERIKDFTLAQGFDEFHAYGEMQSKDGNVWGCDDKYLFQAVESSFDSEVPALHVILTVSNHAPYTVDLGQEGFDADRITAGLPEKYRSDQSLLTQLGHFWYGDKMLAEFVGTMRSKYPDSLFVITGDHADRLNIEPSPGLYKRYAVPFVISGPGITKQIFPNPAAGSHIDIVPTIIELIAPEGFEYYAAGNSLTRGSNVGFNYGFWITPEYIGKIGESSGNKLPDAGNTAITPDVNLIQEKIDATRAVSWWRVKNGKRLNY